MSDNALNGWHPGELAIRRLVNLPDKVPLGAVVNKLPDQHRLFHTSRLQYLPVTTLDGDQRPWVSILTAKNGGQGFIDSPSNTSLVINAAVWDGDPIVSNLASSSPHGMLFSGVGLEPSTRRRNKFSGYVPAAVTPTNNEMTIDITVTQALGLCPKYINARELTPHPSKPYIAHQSLYMTEHRLPPEVISFIHSADTAYLGTYYHASSDDSALYPSHLGTNHRGGRPGFIRVRPSDGRTLVLPNYAGNRLLQSLGNMLTTPVASLVIPSFTTGSILYITADRAQTLVGDDAHALMGPNVHVLTTMRVTGYVFVKDALPLRQDPSEIVERSAYNPPVRYLVEEEQDPTKRAEMIPLPPAISSKNDTADDIPIQLVRARVHNASLVSLTWRVSSPSSSSSSPPLVIRPSQNVVLDLSHFIHHTSRTLLPSTTISRANDDCVRTWTVSIPPPPPPAIPTEQEGQEEYSTFTITIRAVQGGLVTPILYNVVASASSPSSSRVDVSHMDIRASLRGIGGDFSVPVIFPPVNPSDKSESGGTRLLWIAGGIGITPFLALTRYVANEVARHLYSVKEQKTRTDVVLVIGCKADEASVLFGLVDEALIRGSFLKDEGQAQAQEDESRLSFTVHIFAKPDSSSSSSPLLPTTTTATRELPAWLTRTVHFHKGRISSSILSSASDIATPNLKERENEIKSEHEDATTFFSSVDAKHRQVQICGPLPFINACMEGLNGAGVDSEDVKRERFTY